MEYMSAREAADKWGISQRRVAVLCSEQRISKATMVGNMWIIPSTAQKPTDARRKTSETNKEKIFIVSIEETVSEDFEIKAKNFEDAIKKAIKKYKTSEIVLEPGNLEEKKIMVYDMETKTATDWEKF